MLEREEVLELVRVRFHLDGRLRLELAQPVERALEPVEAVERMQIVVGDDAEAVAARAEGDQPEPVADSHQVNRALPAEPRRHARLPRGIVRPLVDLDPRAEPPPRRVRAVGARTNQTELPLEQADAPAR